MYDENNVPANTAVQGRQRGSCGDSSGETTWEDRFRLSVTIFTHIVKSLCK